jgi:hypothetical protein
MAETKQQKPKRNIVKPSFNPQVKNNPFLKGKFNLGQKFTPSMFKQTQHKG